LVSPRHLVDARGGFVCVVGEVEVEYSRGCFSRNSALQREPSFATLAYLTLHKDSTKGGHNAQISRESGA
jgi:hypothetical protein